MSWEPSNLGTTVNLWAVVMAGPNLGIVVGDSGIVARTTDYGISWIRAESRTPFALESATSIDSLHVWVGGSNFVAYTTNGGVSWDTATGTRGMSCRAIAFGSPSVGATGGAGGIMFRTTDMGHSWVQTVFATSGKPSITAITFVDSSTAIAVGNKLMLRSSDAGLTWAPVSRPVSGFLFGVSAASSSLVIAGGVASPQGYLLRSTDAGLNWDSIAIVGASSIQAISLPDVDTGYVLANSSKVFRTVDGGLTWDSVSTVPSAQKLSFASTRVGLTCGYTGAIYRAVFGTVSVEDRGGMPTGFSLSQNYPNPFNPTTVISYQLPVVSKVELEIYDVLGRHVTTLVDAVEQPGSHTVRFDGTELASGVYIYRVRTGSSQQSRAMLLLR